MQLNVLVGNTQSAVSRADALAANSLAGSSPTTAPTGELDEDRDDVVGVSDGKRASASEDPSGSDSGSSLEDESDVNDEVEDPEEEEHTSPMAATTFGSWKRSQRRRRRRRQARVQSPSPGAQVGSSMCVYVCACVCVCARVCVCVCACVNLSQHFVT